MNIKDFTDQSPGQIVPIETHWGPDHAFLPDPLPPRWSFPEQLWPLLASAKEEVALLEGLGRGLANPSILLRPIADQEAIQSSALEGTYATPQQMLLFELDPDRATSEHDQAGEVANYRHALQHGIDSELPLCLRSIRDMHRILLTGVRGSDKIPGEFRTKQVGIGASGRFIPPPPERLMNFLDPFEKYLHNEANSFDPLVKSFLVHYQFEAIHPFEDGNGRIGRVLLALMLQLECRLTKPWLYLSGFFNSNRDDYIRLLFNVSEKGGWTSWIEFCLQGTIQQARETSRKCERLRELKDDYLRKLQQLGSAGRLTKIVDRLFETPYMRISDLKVLLEVTDPTARSDAKKLVAAGILREVPETWPRVYYPPDVMHIAYDVEP